MEIINLPTDQYFAGLFDGEGCVHVHTSKKLFVHVALKVSMCDREPILALYKRFGCYFTDGNTVICSGRKVFTWEASNGDAIEPIKALAPYALLKGPAMWAALPLAQSMANNSRKAVLSRSEKEARIVAIEAIRRAYTREDAIKIVDPAWKEAYLKDKDFGSTKVRRKIRLDDGREFESITAAGKALGVTCAAVSTSMRRKGKVAGHIAEYM